MPSALYALTENVLLYHSVVWLVWFFQHIGSLPGVTTLMWISTWTAHNNVRVFMLTGFQNWFEVAKPIWRGLNRPYKSRIYHFFWIDILSCREAGAEAKFKEISNAYEVNYLSFFFNVLWISVVALFLWTKVELHFRIKLVLQVLSDDEKRSIYDRYGEAGLKGSGMGTGVSTCNFYITNLSSF